MQTFRKKTYVRSVSKKTSLIVFTHYKTPWWSCKFQVFEKLSISQLPMHILPSIRNVWKKNVRRFYIEKKHLVENALSQSWWAENSNVPANRRRQQDSFGLVNRHPKTSEVSLKARRLEGGITTKEKDLFLFYFLDLVPTSNCRAS